MAVRSDGASEGSLEGQGKRHRAVQLFPRWATSPKLKICVGLGKSLFGPRDLPRAVGLIGHPMVLAQAGNDTADHGNPDNLAQLSPVSSICWPSGIL